MVVTKPRAIVFLAAAVGVAHAQRDEMLVWTQDAAATIHRKTIVAAEKEAGIYGGTVSVSVSESTPTILSFFLRSTREERDEGADGRKIVCVSETRGWRIPFTNVAYASSGSACSVGDYAADALRRMNEPGYKFLY